MRAAERLVATTCLLAGAAACSLSLDFEGLRTRAPDAGGAPDAALGLDAAADAPVVDGGEDAAPPVALVKCNGATCAAGEGCCVETDGGARCSASSACAASFAPCDGSEDCPISQVCCGWGTYENTGNPLVVACRSPSTCASQGGHRIFCDVDAPQCELEQRCIATGTMPGAFKCE